MREAAVCSCTARLEARTPCMPGLNTLMSMFTVSHSSVCHHTGQAARMYAEPGHLGDVQGLQQEPTRLYCGFTTRSYKSEDFGVRAVNASCELNLPPWPTCQGSAAASASPDMASTPPSWGRVLRSVQMVGLHEASQQNTTTRLHASQS